MENNKLIAEFLGHKYVAESSNVFEHYIIDGVTRPPYQIKYHTSWDWLIEVVKKLKEVTNEDEFLSKLPTKESRRAINLETKLENCFRKSYLEIQEVYNTCLEFIEWYNEQK